MVKCHGELKLGYCPQMSQCGYLVSIANWSMNPMLGNDAQSWVTSERAAIAIVGYWSCYRYPTKLYLSIFIEGSDISFPAIWSPVMLFLLCRYSPDFNKTIESCRKLLRKLKRRYFLVKMFGTIVCYLNKYAIISINSKDLIQARMAQFLWGKYFVYVSLCNLQKVIKTIEQTGTEKIQTPLEKKSAVAWDQWRY